MNKILFSTLITFTLLSCSKDDSNNSAVIVPLIKTITITRNGGTPSVYTYRYENGKVKEAVFNNNNSGYTARYTADSVIFSNYDPSHQPLGTSSWKLNSKGYGERAAFYTISSNSTAYQNYEFNADNRTTKITNSSLPPDEFYYFFTGNRLDSFKQVNNNKVIVRDIIEEAATDLPNTIGNANTGTAFLGNDWLMLKRKTRYVYNYPSGVLRETIVTTITYETSNGRVTNYVKTDISSLSGTSNEIVTYVYY